MAMPVDKGLDHSADLLTEGYHFMRNRFDEFGTDIFETRLMGKKMICMKGPEAVRLFYDDSRFKREGAVPKRIQKSLFGEGGVQTLDGTAHQVRKLIFLSLMTEAAVRRVHQLTLEQWRLEASRWKSGQEVILFDKAEEVLCRVACLWAGVPLKESEVSQRAYDLGALIDAFGGVGPRYREGRRARKRTEEWIRSLIEKYRSGAVADGDHPLETIAIHKDENGQLLDAQIAAVELINILRPIVAVARFIVFGALALHDFPQYRTKLKGADAEFMEAFAQEIRRYYPFAPFLGAMARHDFEWRGYQFKEGDSVLIDLYGTNHDPKSWNQPDQFNPHRFIEETVSPYNFVPQGGGDPARGHRCPGEAITVAIIKASLSFLVEELDYSVVKDQDLSINMSRMPTLPASRMIIQTK
ncbi:cytochrome P450 [Sporosarcina sp. ACRSL]|uniref:cytochrome P450 n=1 Tax=Sporosarcina sp. ACRSL TaxID=2918215 RepID=UPI001EF4D53B|nr:cytochrome P450 [Sporosarcina sp. ACRSL]MCG7344241.1 cytochrome P450 [Sporosarcina sp. ACRSL]